MLQALRIQIGRDIPHNNIRDTAKYPPLMQNRVSGMQPRNLKVLALEEVGAHIQDGQHNPVDDARAALYIYHAHSRDWERHVNGSHQGHGRRFAF
jgi:RNA exonuclease 4